MGTCPRNGFRRGVQEPRGLWGYGEYSSAAHRVTVDVDPDLGLVRNASFTDYVIPTTLDMPDVTIAAFVEEPEPGAPYGAKGIGEPPPSPPPPP